MRKRDEAFKRESDAARCASARRMIPAASCMTVAIEIDRPNQTWMADLTCIGTAEGWLPLPAVLDFFSRRVVGWSIMVDQDVLPVLDRLTKAVWRRGMADALLHQSDRGSQWTSGQFQRTLRDNGLICAMNRAGNVPDSLAMESVFSSIETARTAREICRIRDAASSDVFDDIAHFYTLRRRHSKLRDLSPMA